MNEQAGREMTLAEVVYALPPMHRARVEYQALLNAAAPVVKDDGTVRCTCEWADLANGTVHSDWPAMLDPRCTVHTAPSPTASDEPCRGYFNEAGGGWCMAHLRPRYKCVRQQATSPDANKLLAESLARVKPLVDEGRGALKAPPMVVCVAPSPTASREGDVEQVVACLGDDAAKLRAENPDDEVAANMERAAVLLSTPPPAEAVEAAEIEEAAAMGFTAAHALDRGDHYADLATDATTREQAVEYADIATAYRFAASALRKQAPEHKHTDECWEPDSDCDMGRNEKFARVVPEDKPAAPAAASKKGE